MDTPGAEGQSMHRGREQITAEPLREQVWGWDKTEAQSWLGSRTPHLANDPRSLWNCLFSASWRQLMPLLQAVSQTHKSEQEAVWHGSGEEVSLVPTLPAREWGLSKWWLHPFHASREFLEQAAGSYCSQAPLTKIVISRLDDEQAKVWGSLERTWLQELSSFFQATAGLKWPHQTCCYHL